MTEAIKSMKAEIDTLKMKVSSISDINKEGKEMMNMMKTLKEDIQNIKYVNSKICDKIRLLEKEIEESDSEESLCFEEKELTEYNDREKPQIECNICNFKCERETTLRKHINTKHCKEDSKTYDHITEENDMFQIEIVDNETVYACNICDQGFEESDEVKKHITQVHQDIINHILTKVTDENADNDLDKCENEEIIESEDIITENEVKEDDGKFTCTLCYERLDGNHESKEHFIKEHMKDMKQPMTGKKCEYVFCMDIELDKCSQFCNYYKNMLDL